MAKGSRKRKKRREPRTILIEVGGRKRPTVEDVESAIKRKLATQPTDIFRNTETLIIVLEDEGK